MCKEPCKWSPLPPCILGLGCLGGHGAQGGWGRRCLATMQALPCRHWAAKRTIMPAHTRPACPLASHRMSPSRRPTGSGTAPGGATAPSRASLRCAHAQPALADLRLQSCPSRGCGAACLQCDNVACRCCRRVALQHCAAHCSSSYRSSSWLPPLCTNLHLLQRVLRMLSIVELWLLAVSTFVMLYAHFLQASRGCCWLVGWCGTCGEILRDASSVWFPCLCTTAGRRCLQLNAAASAAAPRCCSRSTAGPRLCPKNT